MRKKLIQLRKELKLQQDAWARHNKKWKCTIDGSCLPRARYQARTETLNYAIGLLTNRKNLMPLSVDD